MTRASSSRQISLMNQASNIQVRSQVSSIAVQPKNELTRVCNMRHTEAQGPVQVIF